jgi:hypothetical protein
VLHLDQELVVTDQQPFQALRLDREVNDQQPFQALQRDQELVVIVQLLFQAIDR